MPITTHRSLHETPRWVGLLALIVQICACSGDAERDPTADVSGSDAGDVILAPDTDWTPDVRVDAADVVEPRPWPRVTVIDVRLAAGDLAQMRADPQSREEYDAALVVDGTAYGDGEVEIHGGFARSVPKLSYRIKFSDDDIWDSGHFGADLEEHERLVLQASWVDPTFIRNCLTLDLARHVGGLAPRCQYVDLALNGQAHGLYVGIERVDDRFLTRNGLSADGLVVKAASNNANWQDKPNPLDGYEIQINNEAPTQSLNTLLDVCTNTPANTDSFESEIAPMLNLDMFMAWQLAHTLADNRDTFTKNYYLHYDWVGQATPFEIITWDADATWGRNWDGATLDPSEITRLWGTDDFSPRLFSIESYRAQYEADYAAWIDEENIAEWLHENVDARAALIGELAQRDLDRWQPGLRFQDEVDALHEAIDARVAAMRSALE
ncbi:MAG: hypothetical protein ACI81R_001570 [Bradymonadia bacterium]|jgi:hypothetical protein